MIGRSIIVVFQRGDDKNEIHHVGSAPFFANEEEFERRVIEESIKKNWKPEDVVNDAELEKIVNATNCIGPEREGFHKWASDGVMVFNLSGNPNLYNPATARRKILKEQFAKRTEGMIRLKEFIPELVELRKAIPTGSIQVNLTIPVTVKVDSSVYRGIDDVYVLNEKGEQVDYASRLIDREELAKFPEISAVINCPHRQAYHKRCKELTELLGLDEHDAENQTYSASRKPNGEQP